MSRKVLQAAVTALTMFHAAPLWAASPTALESFEPSAFFFLAEQRLSVNDTDAAEHVLREGMRAHPAAAGFHGALGRVLAAKDKKADAFYELQWELLRSGVDSPAGMRAASDAAGLLRSGDAEIREVADAMHQMGADPSGSRSRLSRVRAARGEAGAHPVLDLLIAEAARLAGDERAAERGLRSVIERDPAFIPAYAELASLLEATGNPAEAAMLETRARSMAPGHWSLARAGGAK